MTFKGAHPDPKLLGLEELPGRSHYFIGHDPQKWRRNVPHYARVEYEDLYPGVNAIFYGSQHQLEYDLVLAPGADPRKIRLSFQGARKLRIDPEGDLVLETKAGEIRQRKPIVYQEREGVREPIAGRYVLKGKRQVGFEVSRYDRERPLVIDPQLAYSAFWGGSYGEAAGDVAVDGAGSIYVVGTTQSQDFLAIPPNPSLPSRAGVDVFVAKLQPPERLVYVSYLVGSDVDFGNGIAVDPFGNAVVTGWTASLDFPVVRAIQSMNNGGRFTPGGDVFVARLSADGSGLVYSTYLGGTDGEVGNRVAVDAAGNAYITGYTTSKVLAGTPSSKPFPTKNPLQGPGGGAFDFDAFVTVLGPFGELGYSTYLGGNDAEVGHDIALDAAGEVYVAGEIWSLSYPGATNRNAGVVDAFVARLSVGPAGSVLRYFTFFGGSLADIGRGIAVEGGGTVYLAGISESVDLPKPAGSTPFQDSNAGGAFSEDAFVAKLGED